MEGSTIRKPIGLETTEERAVLVGTSRKGGTARRELDEHLAELRELADTAGAVTVGELTQQMERPETSTYLGKGKLEELKDSVAAKGATVVIFDDELTPAQGRNVEQTLGTRVIDRAELILDIFATRARTSEARMQVELAQLRYTLPRLTRMWTHLEKFRGGIGMRGPGETQLETDRRLINQRIKLLEERLADVQRTREVQRRSRRSEFRASLVGYTNAGKSSILRALSGASEVFVEDRLFATLDPLTREVDLGEGNRVLLTDTVGFIRKLPHHLVASFRATLEETRDADLLLHVIDASHPGWADHRAVVEEVLAEIEVAEKPVLHVFNKMDRMDDDQQAGFATQVRHDLPESVFVSATAADGLEPLRRALLAAVRKLRPIAELRLSAGDGRLMAEIHRSGEVLETRSEGDQMILRARLDAATLGRLKREGVAVE